MEEITGTITKGMGKAAQFIPHYEQKIKEVLNFKPFPGTLNLQLDEKNNKLFQQIKEKSKNSITIKPFNNFGAIYLIRISIKNIPNAAILIPEKTTHQKYIIELIAEQNIKETLKKTDNEKVSFTLK